MIPSDAILQSLSAEAVIRVAIRHLDSDASAFHGDPIGPPPPTLARDLEWILSGADARELAWWAAVLRVALDEERERNATEVRN